MTSFAHLEGFDWDEGNIRKNWDKHHVTPLECEQVFFNRPLIAADDESHSGREARYYVLGKADAGRQIFIVFTIRNHRIRVISARDMSPKEGRRYREEIEKDPEI